MNERVREGYDRIAEAYAEHRNHFDNEIHLTRFVRLLATGSKVLDVGSGSGMPVARFLVSCGLAVTGIDISPRQVELARNNVPQAHFEIADMDSLREGQYPVDGVVAMYSIFHIDRNHHGRLLQTLHSYLSRGGAFLATMGADDWEGSDADFHGAETLWSHFGPERNRELIEAAGFTIVLDAIDTSGGERHQVVLGTA